MKRNSLIRRAEAALEPGLFRRAYRRYNVRRQLALTARKSRTFRVLHQRGLGTPKWNSKEFLAFATEGYRMNPWVFAAVNGKMKAMAGIEVTLYKVNPDGKSQEGITLAMEKKAAALGRPSPRPAALMRFRDAEAAEWTRKLGCNSYVARGVAMKAMLAREEMERVVAHPVLDLLSCPNPWYQPDWASFEHAHWLALELGGMAILEPITPSSADGEDFTGEPMELYVHTIEHWKPVPPAKGPPPTPLPGAVFRYDHRTPFPFDPDPNKSSFWINKYTHPTEPLAGMSPLEAAARSVDINNEGRRWQMALLQNDAVSPFILQGPADDHMRNQLRVNWDNWVGGARSAGYPALIDQQYTIHSNMAASPNDLKWGDTMALGAQEVGVVFNTPSEILGDSVHKTFNNFHEARLSWYTENLLPDKDWEMMRFNQTLMRRYEDDDLLLSYDIDGIEALHEEQAALYKRVASADWLTIQEKRTITGWTPEWEKTDTMLVSIALVPIDDVLGTGATVEPELSTAEAIGAYKTNGVAG